MARERQITVTLRPRVWAEFQRRRAAALKSGAPERGVDSEIVNDWLIECMLQAGAPPSQATSSAPGTSIDNTRSEEDDFGIVLPEGE